MIVEHVKPVSWVDTGEVDKIQPSAVADLEHVVTLAPEDVALLTGPAGPQGLPGVPGVGGAVGPQGPQGIKGIAPAGAVLHFAMAAAPAGWLVCNGSAVSRANYAALFAAIGTLYGAGDGATTFRLPDLRGEFLRGADGGRGVDVGRVLGSGQGCEVQSHSHTLMTAYDPAESGWVAPQKLRYTYAPLNAVVNSAVIGATGGAETRPRNVALLPCISTGGG